MSSFPNHSRTFSCKSKQIYLLWKYSFLPYEHYISIYTIGKTVFHVENMHQDWLANTVFFIISQKTRYLIQQFKGHSPPTVRRRSIMCGEHPADVSSPSSSAAYINTWFVLAPVAACGMARTTATVGGTAPSQSRRGDTKPLWCEAAGWNVCRSSGPPLRLLGVLWLLRHEFWSASGNSTAPCWQVLNCWHVSVGKWKVVLVRLWHVSVQRQQWLSRF